MALPVYAINGLARTRILLCPGSAIKQSSFYEYTKKLQEDPVLLLEDITPDPRPDRTQFSPQNFPNGRMILDLKLSVEPASDLESLQIHRRVLAVVGIIDNDAQFDDAYDQLKQLYPQALTHRLVVFNTTKTDVPSFVSTIPPPEKATAASYYTAKCDIASAILAELSLLSHAYAGYDYVSSPALGRSSNDGWDTPAGSSARSSSNSVAAAASALSTSERRKQRSKGRTLKNVGDLYMLAGNFPQALKHYDDAISALKMAHDHLYHGDAVASVAATYVLMTHFSIPFTVSSVVRSTVGSSTDLSPNSPKTPSNADIVKFLCDTTIAVLNIYQRANRSQQESVSYECICDFILRMCYTLACIRVSGGLTPACLKHLIEGSDIDASGSALVQRKSGVSLEILLGLLNESDILQNRIVQAYSRSHVLSGMASIYQLLKYSRKRSFVVKTLIDVLVPQLMAARITDAAENGIHPVADATLSIATLSDDTLFPTSDVGLISLLDELARTYGGSKDFPPNFGWTEVRKDVLRSCLRLCESLPDLRGIIRYSVSILDTCSKILTRDELANLLLVIDKTSSSASSAGLDHDADILWSRSLVKKMYVVESERKDFIVETNTPAPADNSNNIFLYRPAKLTKKVNVDDAITGFAFCESEVLVKVILENPYVYSIDLASISIASEGALCVWPTFEMILNSSSSTEILFSGIAKETGQLKILGCNIKCGDSSPTLHKYTRPVISSSKLVTKIKHVGYNSFRHLKTPSAALSEDIVLSFNVFDEEPVLELNEKGLETSCIMILEGQTLNLSFGLRNESSIEAQVLDLAFSDATTRELERSLKEETLSEADVYELEYYLVNRRALRYIKPASTVTIPGNSESTVEVEIFGKRGLTSGRIQVEYRRAQGSSEHITVTRNLRIPLSITVNLSIELVSYELVGCSDMKETCELWDHVSSEAIEYEDFALLVFDLKDYWVHGMKVSIEYAENGEDAEFRSTAMIQSGATKRLLIPIRKIFLGCKGWVPIPNLVSKRDKRQADDTKNELFWYREHILDRVRGRWKDVETGAEGNIDLRGFRLSEDMLRTVKKDAVEMRLGVDSRNVCGELSHVKVSIWNRYEKKVHGIFRLLPSVFEEGGMWSTEKNDRKVIVNGQEEVAFTLAGGEKKEMDTEVVYLGLGRYRWSGVCDVKSDGWDEVQTFGSNNVDCIV
ncbi:hypothetical protein CANCADRAFT_31204 [Tortispora caseinolytica NRRL Y-17796]|uniref:Uncharacterized protein n=1 Tax=Tortispora caseinolytica NRRL Y-17796 TaxID=767744 RepID=A0A1E4TER6_9ASCO|nr:hypothetical protein CANCADRAFT_31204 [Tortispora caseinolytica NRRL Y-17796]